MQATAVSQVGILASKQFKKWRSVLVCSLYFSIYTYTFKGYLSWIIESLTFTWYNKFMNIYVLLVAASFLHVFIVYVDEIHVEIQINVYNSDMIFFKFNNRCLTFMRVRSPSLYLNSIIDIVVCHLKMVNTSTVKILDNMACSI